MLDIFYLIVMKIAYRIKGLESVNGAACDAIGIGSFEGDFILIEIGLF